MKISSFAAAPVCAAVLLLAGCGGGSDSTAAATPAATSPSASAVSPTPAASKASGTPVTPKGFKLAVDKKNGYQVALPSGFERISKKSDLDRVMKAGKKALSSKGLVAQLDNKTLKMLSVNGSTGDAINVVVTGAGGVTADQLPEMKTLLKNQAKQLGGTGVKVKTTTLGSEPAIRTDYKVDLAGRTLTAVQYVAIHGDNVYTLTFTEPLKMSAATEQKTVDSFTFL